MTKRIAAALFTGLATSLISLPAIAQQTSSVPSGVQAENLFWIQIEAQPTLREAQERVRSYAARLDGVNGFRIGGNWYGVILGPYTEAAANIQLRSLKNAGLIPRDSFITYSNKLRQQFWPVGANALNTDPLEASDAAETATETNQTPAEGEQIASVAQPDASPILTEPEPPRDETRREALDGERLLDRDQRKALQVALQWEGYYASAIDGAFGAGTRRSMAAWQTDRGYDPTGVLTTRQRDELLASFQTVIGSIGIRPYEDAQAGISIAIPGAMVEFARYEAPFVHFDTKDDSGVRVVLISQTGDQDTLYGLYDILQSLEIVPVEGPRERNKSSFTIEGTDGDITSYTQAQLVDGTVKGFTLIWPVGDEKRRNMVLQDMKASFTSLGSQALADNAGLDAATQSLDLLSGLEIRTPELSRSGFYVDAKGTILTTAEAVKGCNRVTVNDDYVVDVSALDDARGLALLAPQDPLAPLAYAAFLTVDPRLKSDVAVAGYSYEGRLSAPSLTYGSLSELTGLNGEAELNRLTLAALPGDAGGPVLDAGGAVMGMLLPSQVSAGRALPEGVSFALDATSVTTFLSENGITPDATDAGASMDPVDLSSRAADMTVLVSCWK
ncbi:trypsin-like peptidase domain-containing protein [Aliiroseovarius sp. Z3]|uniref:trypsin-like peptidase domain-containing protein n=1 Tax=Aliiroseovarius sp. Z3 TaxID=2811402 RepID=UPI0023B29F85|nr:trypsin-like peptidase domain-containing protein [Aliiroseovarius sp. Z3]MDE9450819.1 trypsin-like peptidase domain-containing protein [Aliiroseovarius sp. Z3]